MDLLVLRSGDTLPSPEVILARGISALALPAQEPLPVEPAGVARYVTLDAASPRAGEPCRGANGEPATGSGGRVLACPNNEENTVAQEAAVLAATRQGSEGVLLDAPDAWYAAGSHGVGFCAACEASFTRELTALYGEQFQSGPVLATLAAAPDTAPFWREREAWRLASGLELGRRLVRRVRDEGRRERGLELQVGGRLSGLSAVSVMLAQRLDFALADAPMPSADRANLGVVEILRAALSLRPLTLFATAEIAALPVLTRQASLLASCVGAELSLPTNAPEASHEALASLRRFSREFRSRYRPSERLAEVLLYYSARSDHWSRGAHGAGVLAMAEALTRLGTQYRVVLEVPRAGTEPVILIDVPFMTEADAARIDHRITQGAGAIVAGTIGTGDEGGRTISGPFAELAVGLNRVGTGTVLALDLSTPPGPRTVDPMLPPLEKALESLLGRGRKAVTVGRPGIIAKAYVDPDRKLDLHLVARPFDLANSRLEEVKGLTVHLGGAAVSGARTGYLFSPDAPERKVTMTAYGMGVQATLPDFVGSAVLTVAR